MLCSSSFTYSVSFWLCHLCVGSRVERGGKIQCTKHKRNLLIWRLKASFCGDNNPGGTNHNKTPLNKSDPLLLLICFAPWYWFWNSQAVLTSVFFRDGFSIPITISSCKKTIFVLLLGGMFSFHSSGSPSLFLVLLGFFKLVVWHS